jgi:glycosyltransferase involved in cell wall biosynthesis
VVLYVGRLIGAKGVDVLLRAAGRLKDAGVEPCLWIVGDGPERAGLEELRRQAALERTRFLGNVASDGLPELYAAADLFVLPSLHEPWGTVACEAAACGLPLLLSDRVGAAPDAVEPGRNGWTFPAGDTPALAGRMEMLLSDPEGLRRMGRRSRERAARFRHRECVAEFLSAVRAAGAFGGLGCRTADS